MAATHQERVGWVNSLNRGRVESVNADTGRRFKPRASSVRVYQASLRVALVTGEARPATKDEREQSQYRAYDSSHRGTSLPGVESDSNRPD